MPDSSHARDRCCDHARPLRYFSSVILWAVARLDYGKPNPTSDHRTYVETAAQEIRHTLAIIKQDLCQRKRSFQTVSPFSCRSTAATQVCDGRFLILYGYAQGDVWSAKSNLGGTCSLSNGMLIVKYVDCWIVCALSPMFRCRCLVIRPLQKGRQPRPQLNTQRKVKTTHSDSKIPVESLTDTRLAVGGPVVGRYDSIGFIRGTRTLKLPPPHIGLRARKLGGCVPRE